MLSGRSTHSLDHSLSELETTLIDLISSIPSMNQALHAQFQSGKTRSLVWRKQQLSQGIRMLSENKEKVSCVCVCVCVCVCAPMCEGVCVRAYV
jgi:hypothetical protein